MTVKPTKHFLRLFKSQYETLPTTGTTTSDYIVEWEDGTKTVFSSREAFQYYCEVIGDR